MGDETVVIKETKCYVEFSIFTGRFFDEDETQEVDSFSVEGITIPEGTIAYRFFHKDLKRVQVDGEPFEKWTTPYDKTGWHYIGGVKQTLEEIPDIPENEILRSNLRLNSNYYEYVVRTRFGTYRFFDTQDVLVS